MKIAIIEDEIYYSAVIIEELNKRYSLDNIDVFKCIRDYEKKDKRYDIIILDIQLENENGLDYLKYHSFHSYVLFLTSHTELVYECFHRDVVGFIPKVQLKQKLLDKLQKIEEFIILETDYTFETFMESINIKKSEILFFEYVNESIYLYSKNQRRAIEIYEKNMGKLENRLDDSFMRVSRKNIVNLSQIDKVKKIEHLIIFYNRGEIKISERKWALFKKRYRIMRTTYE